MQIVASEDYEEISPSWLDEEESYWPDYFGTGPCTRAEVDDSLEDWMLEEKDLVKGDCFSLLDSQDLQPTQEVLGELGMYGPEPQPQEGEPFMQKYAERHWHAKSWKLDLRHPFLGAAPGPSENVPKGAIEPIDFFSLLWDEKICRKIVKEINAYVRTWNPKTRHPKGGAKGREPLKMKEFCCFLGILLIMGVRHEPRIRDYWRESSNALYCEVIATTMRRARFEWILRCLHLVNKNTIVSDRSSPHFDPFAKSRWLLEDLVWNFQAHQNPDEFLSIDECMIPYSGRYCRFRQFLPRKPVRYGIKVWALCCATSKYIYDMEVYVGKPDDPATPGDDVPTEVDDLVPEENQDALLKEAPPLTNRIESSVVTKKRKQPTGDPCGIGGAVVKCLLSGLEHKFHIIAMDRYFTSPVSFDTLLDLGFYAVDTCKQSRRGFPHSLAVGNGEKRGLLNIRVH
jgi:hypothetical protein